MDPAALGKAIESGANLETIKLLIENGASVNEREYLVYALEVAVDQNNAGIVEYLLKYVNFDLTEMRDGRDNNVLHHACAADNPSSEIVKVILDYGIDVNRDNRYGETALHLACRSGNKQIVQLLLDHGIDVNYVDEHSDCCSTAIYYTISEESTEIFELLLKYGAEILTAAVSDVSVYRSTTSTPKIHKIILKHIANLSSKREIDWTNLSCAIFNKDFTLVKQLIENGHEIDMLCVYTAVVCDNRDILELVWNNVSSELFSNDLYFMIHVFDNWSNEDKIGKLWLLLNKEGVNLHLERCGKAFAFFIERMSNDVFENVTDDEQLALLQCLEAKGLKLNGANAEQIIYSVYDPSSTKILEFIINTFLPKITRTAFIKACENGSDKFVLQYCLDADFHALYEADGFEFTEENLQYYLERFSITDIDRDYIIHRNECREPDASKPKYQIKRMMDRANFKSLLQLSRDVVRNQLNKICKDSRQLLDILDILNLSTRIRDIIQCKTPVNPLVSLQMDA